MRERKTLNWSSTSIPISFQKKDLTYEYDPVLKRWNYTSNFHKKNILMPALGLFELPQH